MNDHDPGDEHTRRHRPMTPYVGLWPKAYAINERRRAENVCINSGPKSKVEHGAVASGGKCQRCHEQHRRSA